MNIEMKQLNYISNFLKLKFDTLLMKAQLQKNKLKIVLERVKKFYKRKVQLLIRTYSLYLTFFFLQPSLFI